MLDPENLKAFLFVAECGGFTRAAEQLNKTQAAVSQQIKRLEETLNVRLFDRHSRSVTLSPHGHLLIGYARKHMALHEETMTAFRNNDVKQTVRLGTPDDYATGFLPAFINRFSQNHPLAEIEVVCDTSGNLLEALDKREIDLALVTRSKGDTSGDLVRIEPVYWVGMPDGMAHKREVIPLALFNTDNMKCPFRYGSVSHLDEIERPYYVAYSSHSVAVLLSAIRTGLAISVLARSSIPSDLIALGEEDGLPKLPDIEIALHRRHGKKEKIIDQLGDYIIEALAIEKITHFE